MSKKTNIEEKPAQVIITLGIGKNEAGEYGVYVTELDVANNKALTSNFINEIKVSEAVERFKILAGNLFLEV